MRHVRTERPSFPDAPIDSLLELADNERWQVACGDDGHWRVGFYSPAEAATEDIEELEKHDCPEFFMLLKGRLNLLIAKSDKLTVVELEPMKPILVESPHCGFCPDGPHSGMAIVVESDAFDTEYRKPREWLD